MSNHSYNIERKPLPAKAAKIGYLLTAVGVVLTVIAYMTDPTRAAFNNVIAFMFLFGLGACSLFLVGLEYVAGAVWSVPFRRIAEFLAPLAFIAPIIAIPVLFNMDSVFHWAHHGPEAHDPILEGKAPYLNVTFFVIRLVAAAVIMGVFYGILTWNSRKQDKTKDPNLTKLNIRFSAMLIPLFGISITVIGIDWLMSVEPHWFSTIFGVYYFAGSLLSAFAVVTFIAVVLYEKGYYPKEIGRDHFYNLGAFKFAFINFWAYIAFSQYLLIWYANIPEETFWFQNRSEGSWLYWSIGLIFVHFLIPYVALLSQPSKSNFRTLKIMAIWMVFARFYDIYWLAMPTYSKDGIALGWIELAFVILAIGIVIMVFTRFYKQAPLIPKGDPKLDRAMHFHL